MFSHAVFRLSRNDLSYCFGVPRLISCVSPVPEGKSIVKLFEQQSQIPVTVPPEAQFVPFTAQTRMSGIDLPNGRRIRKGAADAIIHFVAGNQGSVPSELSTLVASVASKGASPLVVAGSPVATWQRQPIDPQRFGPLGDRLRAMLERVITFQVIILTDF